MVEMETNDEIKRYIDSRYTSSIEAMWRLRGYKVHDRYPFVERMHVHTEDGQNVYFKECDDLKEVLKRESIKQTQLLEWFKSNEKRPEFRHITFFNYPKYFRWDKAKKTWIKRTYNKSKNKSSGAKEGPDVKSYSEIVVRPYLISPKETERFLLQQVLKRSPGAKSFADLQTVRGVKYNSFRETAKALGFF